jgi:uncharacterized integral membrane protein
MAFTYKRRRPWIVLNFWVYRRVVALAMVLGIMLWFIWANNAPVTVAFPFGLGKLESTIGLVILLSSLVGAVATALVLTLVYAVRLRQPSGSRGGDDGGTELPEDRPPPDYASKTTEGFPKSHWS